MFEPQMSMAGVVVRTRLIQMKAFPPGPPAVANPAV